MQREVHPAQQHEHDRDRFDHRAVEVADTGVVGRKAADGDGRERMRDGVEDLHPRRPVGRCAGHRQTDVDKPEIACRLRNAGSQLGILHGTGHLGSEELHAADTEQREDGHGQYDDAHATKPLQLLAIPEQGARKIIETYDHRCSGGGQPRHGLEHGIGHRDVQHRIQVQRQSTKDPEDQPEHHHDHEAVAHLQVSARPEERRPDQSPGPHQDGECLQEHPTAGSRRRSSRSALAAAWSG
jgi:hypothetical protein